MNERIKELIEQAPESDKIGCKYNDPTMDYVLEEFFNKQMFAELIIRECCKEITQEPFNAGMASLWLKQHFGVEE